MKKKNQGSIIMISSIYSVVSQDPELYKGTNLVDNQVYPIIKSGINAFTKQMSSFYGKYNIRLNSLSPGGLEGEIKGSKNIQNKVLQPMKNKIIDTLSLAKKIYPGQSVSLDALSKRHKINIERKNHGALLDAEILAEVFLEMNGGRQQYINLVNNIENKKIEMKLTKQNYSRKIYAITEKEKELHKELLEFINNY